MVYWYEGLLLYIVFNLVPTLGVDPSCECAVFQSNGLSQGHFHSPDYPKHYPNLNCVLYSFIGDVNEIVEINFVDMDLKPPSNYPRRCTDRLRIYKNLDRAGINENIRYDDELCGNLSSLEDKKFFSSGRALVFEFHSEYDPRNRYKGFKGIYTFLEKSSFKTDGELEHGTQCSYLMQSANNQTRGKFFSPKYPQKYSRSASCQYIFNGRETEIVKVIFKIIKLPNQLIKSPNGCDENGDVIRVYDGRDSSMRLLSSICDTRNQEQIQSSGPYMYIEFMSDTHHEKQGFAAEYEFIDVKHKHKSPYEGGPIIQDPKWNRQSSSSNPFLSCNKSINSSDTVKNGIIRDPMYPEPYPVGITCEYEFRAQGHERIQLNFTEMNLHYSIGDPNDPSECDKEDRITVYIYIKDKEESIGEFCGKKPRPQLMSSGERMKVIFKSESKDKDRNSGFRLDYSFRTDFGVLGNGRQDQREVCKFKYYSRSHSSGIFTSPNYPGQYPRNTKCDYLFYGSDSEKVNISFLSFNTVGCDGHDNSDFVEFSNFLHTGDRKMHRYCGNRPSYEPVISDGAFFKVTFVSNEKYDAEGFKAIYNFSKDEKQQSTQTTTDVKSSGSPTCVNASVTLVTIILLCNSVIDYIVRH